MNRSLLLPAPKRGAYDRSLTRAERDGEHRERLLAAAAEVLASGPVTIGKIVERAGVGRSTFYEFFDDPEHVLLTLEQRVLRALALALEAALLEARTPLERARGLSRHWLSELEQKGPEGRVALSVRAPGALLSPAGELMHRTLTRFGEAAHAEVGWGRATDSVAVLAAAAAAEAVARRQLSADPLPEAPRLLADVIIRLLR